MYIGSNFDNFYAYLCHCPHLNWRRYCSIGSLERSQASEYHLVVFWAFFFLFVETILSFFLKAWVWTRCCRTRIICHEKDRIIEAIYVLTARMLKSLMSKDLKRPSLPIFVCGNDFPRSFCRLVMLTVKVFPLRFSSPTRIQSKCDLNIG